MKKNAKGFKKLMVKATEKSLISIADVFAGLPCAGPWYEPKMPKKIKK